MAPEILQNTSRIIINIPPQQPHPIIASYPHTRQQHSRITLLLSPHIPSPSVLVVELVEEEEADDDQVDDRLDQDGPDHLLAGSVAILLLVNALHVQVEVLVLQFEAEHDEGNGEVAELHELAQAEVAEAGPQPEDKLHEFELAIDDLFEDEVEGEGVGEAERVLGQAPLEQVAVDVEGEVPVIVADEGVDQRALVHEDDRQREQEEVGGQRVPRDVDALEEIADRGEVLAQSDRQVEDAKQGKVEQLVRVEGHLVVHVVAEHQPPSVQKVHVQSENAHGDDLELGLLEDLHFVREKDLDDGQQVRGQGLGREDDLLVIAKHAVDDQVGDPDDVVLADEDRDQRDQPQPPLAFGEVVVEHRSNHGHAGRVGVVQEVKEVDRGSEGEVQAAREVPRTRLQEIVDLKHVHHEDVREKQTINGTHHPQLRRQHHCEQPLQDVQPRRGGDLGIPVGELVTAVGSKLVVVEILIHVRLGDETVKEVEQDDVRNIDEEQQLQDGVTLLKNRGFFLFESEQGLEHFHLLLL